MPDIIITELIGIKCGNDWHRFYIGTIRREKDSDGNSIIYGSVIINEGKIWCMSENQDELGRRLDAMCSMKLDSGLHETSGMIGRIAESDYYLN